MPRFPFWSSRIDSVSAPAVFLFENVRTEVGVETEVLVRIEAMRDVDVAFPDASSLAKRSPVPMLFAAVDEARWDIERTSTTLELFESVSAAERADTDESDV